MQSYNNTSTLIVLCILLLIGGNSRLLLAEPINETLPTNTLIANAEYLPGDTTKPAILVLHGFLQTYEFMATRNIINGLSSLDYTVLAPNISLGVPDRRQSKQCQAAHANSFLDDLAEIHFWIKWLQQRGHASVILVGHSWGSQHALGYRLQHPDAPITAIIAISLVRSHQASEVHQQQIVAARQRQQKGDNSLQPYMLSFCKNFMATPGSYLSYAEWSDTKVLDTLGRLQKLKIPVYTVIGSADKRIDQQWLQQLTPLVTKVTVIDGANHFFSHVHEFDLNDQLEIIVKSLTN